VVRAYGLNSSSTRQVSVAGSWAQWNEIMGLRWRAENFPVDVSVQYVCRWSVLQTAN